MQLNSGSRFRGKYTEKTRDYGIPHKLIRWYLIRAQQYIKPCSITRLQAHEAVYLEKYLTAKHRENFMYK